MSNQAIAATGTLIQRNPLGAGAYTTIGELRDIKPPGLGRTWIPTNSHNDPDSSGVPSGILTKSEMTFGVGFLPGVSGSGHDHLTGLVQAVRGKTLDWYKLIYPNGTFWAFSGYVTNVEPNAPVEGDGLTAAVTINATGYMTIT